MWEEDKKNKSRKKDKEKRCIGCDRRKTDLVKNSISHNPFSNKSYIICNDCKDVNTNLFQYNKLQITQEESPSKEDESRIMEEMYTPYSPRYFYNYLNRYVSGHKEGKKAISVIFSNHIKRTEEVSNVPKDCVLLCGRTGMGKTHLVTTIAKSLSLPLVIVDSSSMTGAGWVGSDVTSALEQLYIKSGKNLDLTQRGIIMFDEFDKKAGSRGKGVDIDTNSVQEQLLKVIEGGKFIIGKDNNKVMIDTTNILFILSGSFEKHIAKNVSPMGKIGLMAKEGQESGGNTKMSHDHDYNDDWLIGTGIIKELLGRISTVIQLGNLSKKEIQSAFMDKEGSAFIQYRNLCAAYGITLKLSKSFIEEITEEIIKRPLGIRLAKRVLAERVNKILFDSWKYENKTVTFYPGGKLKASK